MKRVIAVIPQYLGGGAETVTDSIVEALRPRGYEFILVTEKVTEECSARVASLYAQVVTANCALAHYSTATTARLAELIAPLKGDVLWLIGDEFADIPSLREAIRPGGKIIYHLHSVPFFQVGLKDTYHGNPDNRIDYARWYVCKHMRERLLHSYAKRYRKRTGQTAADVDCFVTLCNGYAEQLAAIYPDMAHKFTAVYNPAREYEPAAHAGTGKLREIVYLGRLSFADKRVDKLLRIYAGITDAHPGWTLKIVGDGPERTNLEQLAGELGLKRIEFCGYTSNPGPILDNASILCMTSEFEGWPMALVEALQRGVAPVAFNCSAGVEELLGNGRGVLIPRNDTGEYMTRLSQLMSSPEWRRQITCTHAEFLQEVSINKIADKWIGLFG